MLDILLLIEGHVHLQSPNKTNILPKTLKRVVDLLFLLSMTLGILCFTANVKGFVHQWGLLLLGLFLMISPSVYYSINHNNYKLALITAILPLIFLNYIYNLTQGSLVGFGDTHMHSYYATLLLDKNDKISFSHFGSVSYYFVNMYIIYNFMYIISGLNISYLAELVPPLINIILVIVVYLIATRLHSPSVGIIALILYGWDIWIIQFGHEMRTQTMGTLLLYLLFLIYIIYYNKSNKSLSEYQIVFLLLLYGIVGSSFTSFSFALIFLISGFISCAAIKKGSHFRGSPFSLRIMFLFIMFFLGYLFYINSGYANLIDFLTKQFTDMVFTSDIPMLPETSGLVRLYSPIIDVEALVLGKIFILVIPLYLLKAIRKNDMPKTVFVGGFICLFILSSFSSMVGLNAVRVYVVAYILKVALISYGIFEFINFTKNINSNNIAKILVLAIVLFFTISSCSKLPAYVIGYIEPIRSEEKIDHLPYWNEDPEQYAASKFASSFSGKNLLVLYTLVAHYNSLTLLNVSSESTRINPTMIGINSSITNKSNCLVIVEDKSDGRDFIYRNILPPIYLYDHLDKIYLNSDYVIYNQNFDHGDFNYAKKIS